MVKVATRKEGSLWYKDHLQPGDSVNTKCLFISRPVRWREIIICTMCAYMFACMRECVMQFSLKILQSHIFGKLILLMNFYTLLKQTRHRAIVLESIGW